MSDTGIRFTFKEDIDKVIGGPERQFKCQLNPRLVIAIDFGTFASGYALQWRSDFENDRQKIHCNTKWNSEGFSTYKTPTCLLLKPDKSLEDFGYEAEIKYAELELEQKEWFFFRNFKMLLYHREDVADDTPVESANNRHLTAIEVFSKSIDYMKTHALDHLQKSGLPNLEEIKWVITVPAIWNDKAKLLMRRAAEKAGIPSSHLSIALEPECAAIYCSQLPVDQLEIQGDSGKIKNVASPGSTIMVVDMGGGTVDISTIQINEGSSMKQVHMSGGGPWGGTRVDEKFMTLLKDVVGEDVMKNFAENNHMDEYDLRMDFESKKRKVKHPSERNADERFEIKLPQSLKELWEAKEKRNIVDILKTKTPSDVQFKHGRLSFHPDVIRKFFKDTVDSFTQYINKALENPEHKGLKIDSLILVGGFAESNFVVQSLRDGLRKLNIPVIRPHSAELAVLNGAVLFGHNEDIISSRISRFTYGVAMIMEFDKKKHKQEEKFESGGKIWANCVFRKHVTRGQEVKLGQWITDKVYYPTDDQQKSATVFIFSSDKKDPIHTTEEGCHCIGRLEVKFPDGPGSKRAVEVSMSFGGTELKVKAVSSGKTFQDSLRLQEI